MTYFLIYMYDDHKHMSTDFCTVLMQKLKYPERQSANLYYKACCQGSLDRYRHRSCHPGRGTSESSSHCCQNKDSSLAASQLQHNVSPWPHARLYGKLFAFDRSVCPLFQKSSCIDWSNRCDRHTKIMKFRINKTF